MIQSINKTIDGQVRLLGLQTDNFRWFICKQTDKQQTSVCKYANGKWIKESRLGFCFLFETAAYGTYIYIDTDK
jgi:hypothetical protein